MTFQAHHFKWQSTISIIWIDDHTMTAVGPYRSRTRDFFMDRFDFQKHDEFFAKLLEYLLKLACMISILYTPYSVCLINKIPTMLKCLLTKNWMSLKLNGLFLNEKHTSKKRIFQKEECCYQRITTSTSIVWLISACVIQTFFEWNQKKLIKLCSGTMHFYSSKDILERLIEVGDTLNGPTTPMMKEYFIAIIQSSMNSRHNGTFISYSNGIKFYTRRSDALKVNQMPFENQITRLIRNIRTLCPHL